LNEFSTAVAPQAEQQRLAAEPGIWMFIIGDMTIFGLFFSTYAYYRALDIEGFRQAQSHLNQNFGLLNTLILLLSSVFVVLALAAIRTHKIKLARIQLSAAALCGLGFIAVKFFEYSEKIKQGYTLVSNDFFMYYYIFTGIHLLHLIIGLAVLLFMIIHLGQKKPNNTSEINIYEGGACYWHMVDLLWIVLFPLFYLLR
jgi:nitric oxide reductase NorE protein